MTWGVVTYCRMRVMVLVISFPTPGVVMLLVHGLVWSGVSPVVDAASELVSIGVSVFAELFRNDRS